MTAFPFALPGFQITDVVPTAGSVLILARSMHPAALCPACHQESFRVHSFYQRSPQDLPVSGQAVRLVLQVRRFRCLNRSCHRRTFAERLPEVVAFAARRTVRLTALLQSFAIQCAGEPGSRLLSSIGMQVSPDTLLRLAKAAPTLSFRVPTILGVDDFALRKGRSYGTLLIDWEQRRPIDLLPDRTAETFARWLQSHPGVKWISRDRSTEYARGAALGAPEAQQVIDRWHVQKNWREALERVLNRVRARLNKPQARRGTSVGGQGTRERSSIERRAAQLSREERKVQYEQVRELFRQGMPITHIAKQLHMNRGTIYKYLGVETFPERAPRADAGSSTGIIQPYTAYLRQRVAEGCRNAQQLYREVRDRGFTGSHKTVSRWLQAQGLLSRQYTLRAVDDELEAWGEAEEPHIVDNQALPSASRPLVAPVARLQLDRPFPSARQLAWLFVKDPSRLNEQEQQVVAFLQQEPRMHQVYHLSQEFLSLLNKQHGEQVESWIATCSCCGIAELEAFAFGLQREVPALIAACSMPYSNGPTEGIITRLKYIKRSMYGRGSFDLLRQRVLHSSSSPAA